MDLRIGYERHYAELGRKTEALYAALREAIIGGQLTEATRLPSSRMLAGLYGMSRGSVNQVYDMLVAEGFVRAAAGSGTFVAYPASEIRASLAEGEAISSPVSLSEWAQRLKPVAIPQVVEPQKSSLTCAQEQVNIQEISFDINRVDSTLFPVEEWKTSLFNEVREMLEPWPIRGASIEGYLPLREAIISDLRRERGIHAELSQLFITNGSMQAIALLSMLLVSPGSTVVVENPGYPGTWRAVDAAGGNVLTASVDDSGIKPQDWDAQLLFVTPTRQFPSGAVLSTSRRLELLDWASRRRAVIVEDDYDSELRWGGRPVEPLKALDRENRVVYVGTFSNTMFVNLRIGYVVLPESLVESFRRAKSLMEPQPSGLTEQRALAHFMRSGSYARHLRRMRRVCGRRLIRFREEMKRMERWFRFVPADAGLHMYAQWRGDRDEYFSFKEACQAEGVSWSDGSRFWFGEPNFHTALFGFAHLDEEQIQAGVDRMATAALKWAGESRH
ncbi:transcriptional regulator [Paenibacillus baekrokdamisoli]|uniref:Transcriptional regulator n=1 Tax=Paenibacillus baekrokdamisoli TaxID=1712516 RepID=A0A3G9J1D2_9BACL|nr:PLP-dependent aminotransferase family protein [Paenibacillus baekrokdamisoli]MBB3069437.1 GntR family transcriptional regulator/MocR family aminotransferase [Paenibacillus baekrokdamisoli]BBH24990.1 transcriptional regulator [Paenibacillus baekrokdamisoli]